MYAYAIAGAIAIVVTAAIVVTVVMVTQVKSSSSSSDDDSGTVSLSTTAKLTYYNSYPACCPNSPNYNSKADTTECADYSGCDCIGQFSAIGKKSFDYVQNHNLVAFYDNSDPNGDNFQKRYGGKSITISKTCNGVYYNFTSIIADTCGNSDCNNCCAQNADKTSGILVDMEYYTVLRNFGNTDCASGKITFSISG